MVEVVSLALRQVVHFILRMGKMVSYQRMQMFGKGGFELGITPWDFQEQPLLHVKFSSGAAFPIANRAQHADFHFRANVDQHQLGLQPIGEVSGRASSAC